MQLMSSDFSPGGAIPVRFTCEGDNVSPEFSWKESPAETKSFALIIHDPDAPRVGGFTHWVLYNIPADKGHLDPEVPKRQQVPGTGMHGRNDSGEIGYMGPCPPLELTAIMPGSLRWIRNSAYDREPLTMNSRKRWRDTFLPGPN